MENEIYTRKCSMCNKELIYKSKLSFMQSLRKNSVCGHCAKSNIVPWNLGLTKESDIRIKAYAKKISKALTGRIINSDVRKNMSEGQLGKKFSELHIQRMRENNAGCKNPMYGKHHTDDTKRRMSIAIKNNHADFSGKNGPRYGTKKSLDERIKISKSKSGNNHPLYGKTRSENIKSKIRITMVNKWKEKYKNTHQHWPMYNPTACKIIDEYGKVNGYKFQHALNGGEVCIGGYFPDGIDKEKKILIEIDERHHFNVDGTYKEKDIKRQLYLESLGYTFIRIKLGEI